MSRRYDESRLKHSNIPSRDRRDAMDQELYFETRHRSGGGARDEVPVRHRRSLSPQDMGERGRRTMGRDRRSDSIERRREYEQHIDRGHGHGHGRSGGGLVLSRSPRIEHSQKRVPVDERAFVASPTSMRNRGNLEYIEYEDYDDLNTRSRNNYRYEDIEDVKQKDYSGRKSGASGHRPLVQSVPFEDTVDRDVRLHPKYGYATTDMEPRGSYSSMDIRRVKDEKIMYRDVIHHERLVKDVYYKDGEQCAYYNRESPFRKVALSQTEEIGNKDLLKNNPSTSAGVVVRGEYMTKLRDGHALSSEGYSKRYGKDLESFVSDDYGQIAVSDIRRGYGAVCTDAKCHVCDAYESSRLERNENSYPEIEAKGDDVIAYASQKKLYTRMKYPREEHDPRDIIRQDIKDLTVKVVPNNEGSHSSRRIFTNIGAQEYDALHKDLALEYVNPRRSTDALIQSRDYYDSGYPHAELTREISNQHQNSDRGSLCKHEFENPYLGNGYGRYSPDGSNTLRMKNSSDLNDLEMQRTAEGFDRIKADDFVNHVRVLKRKYIVDEDVRRVKSRGEIHDEWNRPSGNDDFHDHPAEWTSRKTNIVHSKKPSGYGHNHYGESEEMSDGFYYRQGSTKAGWTSYQDQSESLQEHPAKPYKVGSKLYKGYEKSESSKSYGHVHHSHPRSNHYKQQNLMQKSEPDMSDDPVAYWKSEPSEDSDEYKQRIQSSYLEFSKRLNENPTARKLYKEDGKAGSLFCVVCRRSVSKDFQNTKALATHAFMSHKFGLRPQHLGLHRAICVLMGWNPMPDPGTGTWTPELIPRPEAWDQKGDLILWPPVVIIHNISLSNNDHNKWKLINIDALEEFLRVKGFHLGKMKICLGNPGDHSVILVKFLGTFSGLQEAERLHKLFFERKHGRADFDQAISGSGATDELMQGGNQSEKLEDLLLYGYMGISEDMDSIDFDTKKRCSVKSKKEIHELADAPVKPE